MGMIEYQEAINKLRLLIDDYSEKEIIGHVNRISRRTCLSPYKIISNCLEAAMFNVPMPWAKRE